MVKAKRMMETDENGVERQFYPITHASAVRGLEKIIAGQSKVLSVVAIGRMYTPPSPFDNR